LPTSTQPTPALILPCLAPLGGPRDSRCLRRAPPSMAGRGPRWHRPPRASACLPTRLPRAAAPVPQVGAPCAARPLHAQPARFHPAPPTQMAARAIRCGRETTRTRRAPAGPRRPRGAPAPAARAAGGGRAAARTLGRARPPCQGGGLHGVCAHWAWTALLAAERQGPGAPRDPPLGRCAFGASSAGVPAPPAAGGAALPELTARGGGGAGGGPPAASALPKSRRQASAAAIATLTSFCPSPRSQPALLRHAARARCPGAGAMNWLKEV
jgi:hypothetical protein